MQDFTCWMHTLVELFASTSEEDECLRLVRAMGGRTCAIVHLIEEDLTVLEALTYGRVLKELGQELYAGEVFQHIIDACFDRAPASLPGEWAGLANHIEPAAA